LTKGKTTLPNTPGRKAAQYKYNHQPEQIKRRAERNKARAIMEKKGLVHKGDGKDIDHKNHNTSDESDQNLRVQSLFVNRRNNRPGKKGVTKPR
jgi:hypothetical protein